MRHLALIILIAAGFGFIAEPATAQTVEELNDESSPPQERRNRPSEGTHAAVLPGLLGSVGWTSPTSRTCCTGPIPYVSGFQGGLTAVKRLDPLVAFAGLSYYSQISGDVAGTTFDPSDVIGTRLGASLAVTPATSLTAGLNISFLTDTQSGILPGPQPDDILASVDLGFNTVLWHQTFLNVTSQFGLTGDVPDFRLITSVPVRF